MSKARHKKYKDGGEINAGREKDTFDKEMDGHNKGGAVKARKRGGSVEMGEGEMPKMKRMDRPGRKRGGGVGADMKPLSTANKTSPADGHSADSGEAGS
jgi:hypothetical protein